MSKNFPVFRSKCEIHSNKTFKLNWTMSFDYTDRVKIGTVTFSSSNEGKITVSCEGSNWNYIYPIILHEMKLVNQKVNNTLNHILPEYNAITFESTNDAKWVYQLDGTNGSTLTFSTKNGALWVDNFCSSKNLINRLFQNMCDQETQLYDELMLLCSNEESKDSFYFVDHPINESQTYRVFSYRLAAYELFLIPSALEARGIMFLVDNARNTQTIVSRPFHKFFNIDENPFTAKLDYSKVTNVYKKEDGSLISSYIHREDGKEIVSFKSKTSISSTQALAATRHVYEDKVLLAAIRTTEALGYTVIGEWCSPNNRIVVGYETPQLIILNARHRITGEYMERNKLEGLFDSKYIVPLVELPELNSTVLDELDTHEGYEGIIIQFENDYKVQFAKFKNSWYLHLHRTKDSVLNKGALFDCVVNDRSDDLRTLFKDDVVSIKAIEEMEALVIPLYNKLVSRTETFYQENKHLERKEFAIKAKNGIIKEDSTLDKIAFGAVMSLYTGKPVKHEYHISKHKQAWLSEDEVG